jgi:hypothetical protein
MINCNILKIFFAVIVLSIVPCCVVIKKDASLAGRVYINEKTQDTIEFTKKGTIIIKLLSDKEYWSKNYPNEFLYTINNNDITVTGLSSSQSLIFPYESFEISYLKERIIATTKKGSKEEYKLLE